MINNLPKLVWGASTSFKTLSLEHIQHLCDFSEQQLGVRFLLLVRVAFLDEPQYKDFYLVFFKTRVRNFDFLVFQNCIVEMNQKVR